MDIITKNKIYSKYINYKDIDLSTISYINNIPRLVHRTLLFDSEFPSEFAKLFILFNYNSVGYKTILWREKDLLEILNDGEKHIYSSYKHKIQKMDFARYIILQKYQNKYAVDFRQCRSATSEAKTHLQQLPHCCSLGCFNFHGSCSCLASERN